MTANPRQPLPPLKQIPAQVVCLADYEELARARLRHLRVDGERGQGKGCCHNHQSGGRPAGTPHAAGERKCAQQHAQDEQSASFKLPRGEKSETKSGDALPGADIPILAIARILGVEEARSMRSVCSGVLIVVNAKITNAEGISLGIPVAVVCEVFQLCS